MSQITEIKCPVCGKWSSWTDKTAEKCPHCNAQFEPGRLQYAREKKLNDERALKDSYLLINDSDDTIVEMSKEFLNFLRWTTFYGMTIIYIIIAAMIIIFGLIML